MVRIKRISEELGPGLKHVGGDPFFNPRFFRDLLRGIGHDVVTSLGGGKNGQAYLTRSGRVIKVASDAKSDHPCSGRGNALAAHLLGNLNSDYLVRCYGSSILIYDWDKQRKKAFVIEMENLPNKAPLYQDTLRAIRDAGDRIDRGQVTPEDLLLNFKRSLSSPKTSVLSKLFKGARYVEDDLKLTDKRQQGFYHDFLMMKSLATDLGVEIDIWGDNFRLKNDRLCAIDLGYSIERGSHVDLESLPIVDATRFS
jgi:hypothetical protein